MAQGEAMARAFCLHTCRMAGPDPVIIQGCSLKDPDCTPATAQWTCYNPDSVNANHTAWIPGARHYCRGNSEIKGIHSQCTCKPFGGCPPYEL